MSVPLHNEPKLYTQEEFADLMGVSVAAVRKWRQRKLISFIKVGNVVRFEEKAVIIFLEEHRSPRSA